MSLLKNAADDLPDIADALQRCRDAYAASPADAAAAAPPSPADAPAAAAPAPGSRAVFVSPSASHPARALVEFRGARGERAFVTFAGTASAAGALADAAELNVPFAESRARWIFASAGVVYVHAGFAAQLRALEAPLLAALDAARVEAVEFAGHSLGGALAQLAALRFACSARGARAATSCVHFGAPRVGGAAFADLFARAVPRCVAVVAEHDPVPRAPAFLWWWVRAPSPLVMLPDAHPSAIGGDAALRSHALDEYARRLAAAPTPAPRVRRGLCLATARWRSGAGVAPS
jgi:hypothetical protein